MDFVAGLRPSDKIRIGWGRKRSGRWAETLAGKAGSGFFLLEDGFLRSMGLGVEGDAPLSLVVDDLGIYYDASRPSRLEGLIRDKYLLASHLADAREAMGLIVQHGLSKYNRNQRVESCGSVFEHDRQHVLVVDQTFGDMAIQYGGASAQSFHMMFEAACREYRDAVIWVKTHPDVLAGKKQGYLTDILKETDIRLISDNLNPVELLRKVDAVYTVTSHLGFEALMQGKHVVTFGLPWYAGWGVSDDRHPKISELQQIGRRTKADLLELFAAAYLCYSRYVNPWTGNAGTIFDVIDYLQQHKSREALLSGKIYVFGLSWWKKKVMAPFLQTAANQVKFISSIRECQQIVGDAGAKVLVWGRKQEQVEQWAAQNHIPVLVMEDGFIRSVGLGSNLVPPLSLVVDDQGIYFDARSPSRLENILQNGIFSPKQLQDAERLTDELVRLNVGKYNVGKGGFVAPEPRPGKIILVPGQVEDDASIRYGSPQIQSNLMLLQAVRNRNPDAYIVFKPHPDVLSGNRVGEMAQAEILALADQLVEEADILACIAQADEIHTLTSLAGFEALLRGKKVVCYGLPFYAGWGLTEDVLTVSRRTRQLTLSELVAGSMLVYPIYRCLGRKDISNAFMALQTLHQQRSRAKGGKIHSSWLGRRWRQLKTLAEVAIYMK